MAHYRNNDRRHNNASNILLFILVTIPVATLLFIGYTIYDIQSGWNDYNSKKERESMLRRHFILNDTMSREHSDRITNCIIKNTDVDEAQKCFDLP